MLGANERPYHVREGRHMQVARAGARAYGAQSSEAVNVLR